MAQDPQEQESMQELAQVMSRAWSDPAYKQRLLADPKAVLVEAGLPIPANLEVVAHESTPTQFHIIVPPPPPGHAGDKLSEAELDQVAGGSNWSCSFQCFINWGKSLYSSITGDY
jgi:hypothetical protein